MEIDQAKTSLKSEFQKIAGTYQSVNNQNILTNAASARIEARLIGKQLQLKYNIDDKLLRTFITAYYNQRTAINIASDKIQDWYRLWINSQIYRGNYIYKCDS